MVLSLLELKESDDEGFSVGLKNEDNFFEWEVCFIGPPDTLYEVIPHLEWHV